MIARLSNKAMGARLHDLVFSFVNGRTDVRVRLLIVDDAIIVKLLTNLDALALLYNVNMWVLAAGGLNQQAFCTE